MVKNTQLQLSRSIFFCASKLLLTISSCATAVYFGHKYIEFLGLETLKLESRTCIVAAFIFLSTKANEEYRKLRDIANVVRCYYGHDVSKIDDDNYQIFKEELIIKEHELLRVLQFDTQVDLPYRYFFNIARFSHFKPKDVQISLPFLNDAIHNPIALHTHPALLATASLVLGKMMSLYQECRHDDLFPPPRSPLSPLSSPHSPISSSFLHPPPPPPALLTKTHDEEGGGGRNEKKTKNTTHRNWWEEWEGLFQRVCDGGRGRGEERGGGGTDRTRKGEGRRSFFWDFENELTIQLNPLRRTPSWDEEKDQSEEDYKINRDERREGRERGEEEGGGGRRNIDLNEEEEAEARERPVNREEVREIVQWILATQSILLTISAPSRFKPSPSSPSIPSSPSSPSHSSLSSSSSSSLSSSKQSRRRFSEPNQIKAEGETTDQRDSKKLREDLPMINFDKKIVFRSSSSQK